jgi:hypothetical protein
MTFFAFASVGCQNSRFKPKGKNTNAQVAPPREAPSVYLVSSKVAPYSPTTYIETTVGDTVEFRWNAGGADLISSYYTVDAPDTCTGTGTGVGTGPHAWVANTLMGSTTLSVVPCQLGRTYTYVYEGIDTVTGKSARALTMVRVINPPPAPQPALIKAAVVNAANVDVTGRLGYIEVVPGDKIRIAWDATGAESQTAEITSDGTDSCGTTGLTLQEVNNEVKSEAFRDIEPCQAGRIYTVALKVKRPAVSSPTVESKLLIKVRPNPSVPLPTATLTANGASGTLEITAGQALTFVWSSVNADQGNSSITMTSETGAIACEEDQQRGTVPTSWSALGPKGEIPAVSLPDCKARHTYTISYTAIQTSTGKASTAILTVKVNPRPGS